MFKNSYQSGLLSIFYSCGSHPLALWEMEVNNGHIKRLTDNEVNSIVLEIVSTNVATTYITCPPNNKYLGIKLPFLVMIVKNLKRYFSFEITILDDKNMRRRFRISNFQSTTKIKPFCTTMPIGLSEGWNQIQFNLSDFTRRAYGTQFIETLRVQVHANVRLRRIYFAERLYTEEELPQDYKLYLPLEKKGKKSLKKEAAKQGVTTEAAALDGTPVEPLPDAVASEEGRKLEHRKSIETSRKNLARKSMSTTTTTPEVEKKTSEAGESTAQDKGVPPEAPLETPEGEITAEGEATPVEAIEEGEAGTDGEAPAKGEVEGETTPAGSKTPAEEPAEEPVEVASTAE